MGGEDGDAARGEAEEGGLEGVGEGEGFEAAEDLPLVLDELDHGTKHSRRHR